MKINHYLSLSVLAVSSSLFIASCTETSKAGETAVEAGQDAGKSLIAKGEYLVGIMGCNDCHSPKQMGPNGPEIIKELMLSGYPSDRPVAKFDSATVNSGFSIFYPDLTAAAGPWGISFAANLTPDDTGIGAWTEEQFKKALKEGKYKGMDGSRMLLPPMPWTNYVEMKDEDVSAIFAYLKSIKPVENLVPAPVAPSDM